MIDKLFADHEPEGDPRLQPRRAQAVRDAAALYADDDRLRYLIGDVRDLPRLSRACHGVDVIVHAAALKQVPACEYNPFEAVKTNVIGAENVVAAAIENDVPHDRRALDRQGGQPGQPLRRDQALRRRRSSSRATPTRRTPSPASAPCATATWSAAAAVVVPLFKAQAETGVLTITDERMTRFWITLEEAVHFVIDCASAMVGGETFVPKIPA